MKYNKLVRDKVPEVIKKNNQNPIIHLANDKEYWDKLKEKLVEEVNEFLRDCDKEGEIVDILEVIDAICKFKEFDKNKIENLKKEKAKEKGLFDKKIILDEVKD
jgi:predicted house-cleaning noncanonical NTP pyrophosphatase (MazG superfamily)